MEPSRKAFNVIAGVVAGVGGLYAVLLLPGVRGSAGFNPAIDGWLNNIVDAGVVGVILLRSTLDRRERRGWLLLGLGLAAALCGSVAYYTVYRDMDTTPWWSWADLGWFAFYPLLHVGLVSLLRARSSRMPRSLWLDGVVVGLTAAAVAVAFFGVTVRAEAPGATAFSAAYPAADLLLLAFAVGALVVLGRNAGAAWWLLCGAFVTLAVTDWIYADEVSNGTYVAGGLLDVGWLLPRLFLLAAAWVSANAVQPASVDPAWRRALLVPAACGLAVIAILLDAALRNGSSEAMVLAVAAGVAATARSLLTVAELRDLAAMRELARTDDLTGLANRRHFTAALSDAAADLPGRRVAVLLVDLNRFKEVNDSLGHHIGDELLRVVAVRLAATVGGRDVLARIGGDEFALVLTDVQEAQAREIAWSLRRAFEEPFALEGATVGVDASIGIALGPDHASSAEDLLRMADFAMYAAKEGRRGVEVFDAGRDGVHLHQVERSEALAAGIRSGELVVHYQPQLRLSDDTIEAVEALVRWQHPTDGLLLPAAFLPLAESAGLMKELTVAVLGEALRQQRQWLLQGRRIRVAVNASPSVLVDGAFPRLVEELLAEHGADDGDLTLEVTEELFMADRDAAIHALARLRLAGVRVAVDDYGTGYSSLGYLKDLPVNELKLDRHFVADMRTDSFSAAIVQSTIGLARALGVDFVAEGVEDHETLEQLRQAGCGNAQGYFIGRPQPAAELEPLLGTRYRTPHRRGEHARVVRPEPRP